MGKTSSFTSPNYQSATGASGATAVQNPYSADTVNAAQQQTNQGLNNQQNFVNALQAQNGIGNQSAALAQQQALAGQLGQANGVGLQTGAAGNLQGLAGQYANIAAGNGPNPAMTQLANQTGNNIASQASLAAGQRGAGSNVGLLERNAAAQGAATQQQAVGQAANMQANQQLAALGAQSGIQGQIGQLGQGLTGQQQAQQNAVSNLATQQVGQQQNALNAYNQAALQNQSQNMNALQGQNSQITNYAQNQQALNQQTQQQNASNKQQAGMQIGGALFKGASAAAGGMADGGVVRNKYAEGGSLGDYTFSQPKDNMGLPSSSNLDDQLTNAIANSSPAVNPSAGPNLGLAGVNPQDPNSLARMGSSAGKLSSDVNSAAATPNAAQTALGGIGGDLMNAQGPAQAQRVQLSKAELPTFAKGGEVDPLYSHMHNMLSGRYLPKQQAAPAQGNIFGVNQPAQSNIFGVNKPMLAKGGKVPALVSPGERYLPPKEVEKVVKGHKSPMKAGEKIPGKPKVGGAKNSYANDTVPKTLEEGGVVLPRSVTQAKNPHWAAHKFISALMAKNNGRLK